MSSNWLYQEEIFIEVKKFQDDIFPEGTINMKLVINLEMVKMFGSYYPFS